MGRREKLFVGKRLRRMREEMGLSQAELSKKLGLSASYLSQIEHDQRPVTAKILLDLSTRLGIEINAFAKDDSLRIGAEIGEALLDPVYGTPSVTTSAARAMAQEAPELAEAFLLAHKTLKQFEERLQILDSSIEQRGTAPSNMATAPLAYDEVRDYFHYNNNYIDALDQAGECISREHNIAGQAPLLSLQRYLKTAHDIETVEDSSVDDKDIVMFHDDRNKRIVLNAELPTPTKCFQLASKIGQIECKDLMDDLIKSAAFKNAQSAGIFRIALANYFAGALILPYEKFRAAVEAFRYDIEEIRRTFGASFEQVCHRLSNLQRSGFEGVPFFFVRVDRAGNVTKRHSANKFQFARFGGSCPLWNVHSSFDLNGKIDVQIVETPDGRQYLSIAKTVEKPAARFRDLTRDYAIAFGCALEHAGKLVYADHLKLDGDLSAVQIGFSCRTCARADCRQRAYPPIDRVIAVDMHKKTIVPYQFD